MVDNTKIMTQNIHLINADVITGLRSIKKNSIDLIVTSPPYYGLRDYQVDGQIGMEPTLEEYLERLLEVTAQLKRVMKPTGVLFWNHGDSYGGSGGSGGDYNKGGLREGQPKVSDIGGTPKCLNMQNERLVMRMIDNQGWILRNRIIWHKPNGMPSSVQDRFSNSYEPVYMFTKSIKYHFDLDAVKIPNTPSKRFNINNRMHNGEYMFRKNPGDVWKIHTQPHKDAHFAIFPDKLVEPLVKVGCPLKVCPECGFIRERITEKFNFGIAESDTAFPDGNARSLSQKKQAYRNMGFECVPAPKTTGWTSCDCVSGWNPGTVLDPFAGSGTTMKIAKELGRNVIGIELNSDYCKIIKRNLMFHQYTLGNIVNKFTVLR
jgi:DNA modification methylase